MRTWGAASCGLACMECKAQILQLCRAMSCITISAAHAPDFALIPSFLSLYRHGTESTWHISIEHSDALPGMQCWVMRSWHAVWLKIPALPTPMTPSSSMKVVQLVKWYRERSDGGICCNNYTLNSWECRWRGVHLGAARRTCLH